MTRSCHPKAHFVRREFHVENNNAVLRHGGIRLAWGCVRSRVRSDTIQQTGRGGIFGDHSAELVSLWLVGAASPRYDLPNMPFFVG